MAFRRLLRGSVDSAALDRVAAEVGARYDLPAAEIEPLEANNWLSIPCVVDDELFVKVVTPQNAVVHAVMTAGRNLGIFASGSEGFFERYDTPVEMAEHELVATRKLRELGVNAPEPLDAFEFEGYGVLVLEFLPDYTPFDELDASTVETLVPELYETLATMHEAGIVHGDLQAENVLLADGELHFIDATKVREEAIEDARAYDVACAMAVVESLVDAETAVEAAADVFDDATLLAAEDFLDFVTIRPTHDFDAPELKAAIEKQVA